MIKELFKQTTEHIKWLLNHPCSIWYIIRSYFCYLWKGYSYQDLWDVDYYLLKQFNNIISDFIERSKMIGHPEGLTHKEWVQLLLKSKQWSDLIIEDNYTNVEEALKLDEIKQQWLGFIYLHFFDLWT